MKRLDISNETLRELARIGVVGAFTLLITTISELGWKSARPWTHGPSRGIVRKNALVTHIEWMNENNPSTLR